MYRSLDVALVRATVNPGDLDVPPRPARRGDGGDSARWRAWITEAYRHPVVVEAVQSASPQLAHRLQQITAGAAQDPKHVRNAALSLHRYLLRLKHRATPFGLFAGVAAARIGPRAESVWAEQHRATARVDNAWLHAVIDRLESSPDVLRRLRVVAEPSCFVRDGRVVLPYRRPARDGEHAPPGEVTVRCTPPVRAALQAATSPVDFGDLIAKITHAYPQAPSIDIEELIGNLIALGFLHTGLRPATTMTDPLRHVLAELTRARVTGQAELTTALHDLRHLLREHDGSASHRRARIAASAIEVMTGQSTVSAQPLGVDLRLDCALTLPRYVAREAERAADALSRLTPHPAGSRAWQDYHLRFLEHYGPGAVVPLLRLVDPGTGIDLPAGYRGSLLPREAPPFTDRDRRLLAMAQNAASAHRREIVLTDPFIEALDQRRPGARYEDLPHLDLRFTIRAPSRAALDAGTFTLWVNGAVPCAGATAGRFLDLLDAADRERLASAYAAAPTVVDGARRVQLSSPPLKAHTGNVARVPALLPQLLPIGEAPRRGSVLLSEVGVTADADRLYVVSLTTGQILEPCLVNAVDLVHHTHPLARLLTELPRARTAAFGPFAWGAAQHLPYTPRVRYGRAVLALATWRLDRACLAAPTAGDDEWHESLQVWRKSLDVPAVVEAGASDRRLRLDLDQPADAELLRAELDRDGHAVLREAAEPADLGWFDGRAHEITLALASTQSPARGRTRRFRSGPIEHPGHPPGASPWAYLKLYGHPDHLDTILTTHLPRLWAAQGSSEPTWWFVRYRDPQPHLRLRIALQSPDGFGHVAAQVGAWVTDLHQRGLTHGRPQWDTYVPEIGRYGAGPVMDAAEHVFVTDSAAAVQQIRFASGADVRPQAVTAASLVDLAVRFLDDTAAAMRWFVDHVDASRALHPSRALHREATELAGPEPDRLRQRPGGQKLTQAWTTRAAALGAYRARLAAGDAPTPGEVLPSLLHLHHVRALGPDEADESLCLCLARSAALAWIARRGASS